MTLFFWHIASFTELNKSSVEDGLLYLNINAMWFKQQEGRSHTSAYQTFFVMLFSFTWTRQRDKMLVYDVGLVSDLFSIIRLHVRPNRHRSTSNFSSCFDLSDFYSTALLSVDHAKEVSAIWTMANNGNASASSQSCFELYIWIEARVWKVRTTTTLGDILWCSLIIKLYNQRTVNVRCLRRF